MFKKNKNKILLIFAVMVSTPFLSAREWKQEEGNSITPLREWKQEEGSQAAPMREWKQFEDNQSNPIWDYFEEY